MAQPSVLEEFLVKLSVQGPDSGQLREAEKGFEALRLGIESLLSGLTAAAAGTVAVIKTFADGLTETFYAAQKLGSTTEHITALGDAAERAGGSVEGIRADLDALVAKMRGSSAFKDWLKTNLHLSAADMQTPESILVASSKALAAMRQTDPQHYKALRDYIGTSEATILAVARPEFDVAYKQQKEFVSGLDAIAKKSVELHNDWIAATTHFKEALELISGPFMTAIDAAIKRTDAWLAEEMPAIEAFANSTAQSVAGIITKLGAIPFARIADELFDGLQKGLAKINFDNVKTVFYEFMNWLVTGPLATKIIELVTRIGAASTGFFDTIGQTLAPGMGRVQAPGAPGSQGRFGQGPQGVGRANNQGAASADKTPSGDTTPPPPPAGKDGSPADFAEQLENLHDHDPAGHAKIMQFLRDGGHGMDPATTDWCASFVGSALHKAGYRDIPQVKGGDIANAYQNWGVGVAANDVRRGDVVITTRGLRPGAQGGHVSIATGPMVNGKIPVIDGDTRASDWSPGHPRHQVARDWERDRTGLMYRRGVLPDPALKPQSRLELHDLHTKLAALVSHPGFRQNVAILTNHQSRTIKSQWSQYDGVKNQNVNIEISSTDPHSAASEISRQLRGLQSHTLREWKVA
jgi:hypothetical protein